MGCSSSTQTHSQGGSRPPAKAVETNGPKKMSTSEVSDHIIDDIETIPDQTKLVPLTENEPSTNGIPPEEEKVEVEEAVEVDGAETVPSTEDSNGSFLQAGEEPAQAEEPTEVITNQDSSVVEGEIEEAVEANNHEETVSEEPETKEDETEHPADAAEPEMDTADAEE